MMIEYVENNEDARVLSEKLNNVIEKFNDKFKMEIEKIKDKEAGSYVRGKLNDLIDAANTLDEYYKPKLCFKGGVNLVNYSGETIELDSESQDVKGFTVVNAEDGNILVTPSIATVTDFELSSNGLLVAGNFEEVNDVDAQKLVLLNESGNVATGWNDAKVNNLINTIAVDEINEAILIGGIFTTAGGSFSNRFCRLGFDGIKKVGYPVNLDGINNEIYKILISKYDSSKFYVVGRFTKGIYRYNLSDGTLDTSFNVGTGIGENQNIRDIVEDTSGQIYVAGFFNVYDGNTVSNFCRINVDGSLDTSFAGNNKLSFTAFSSVYSIALESNSIFLAGSDMIWDGVDKKGLLKIDTDATLDSTFDIGTGFGASAVINIAAAKNEKSLFCMSFGSSFNGNSFSGRIIKIDSVTGDFDSDFIGSQDVGLPNLNVLFSLKVKNLGGFLMYSRR